MKHNLRMAFLSLLLVLTLGVMPVFAESADHAMDWTHGIGSRYRTDVTSALPFEDELFFISGSQLLRVDDPEYEPEVVCNLEDIIWSEALKQSGYYGQVMLLDGGAELVLFSANEGRLYSFVPRRMTRWCGCRWSRNSITAPCRKWDGRSFRLQRTCTT